MVRLSTHDLGMIKVLSGLDYAWVCCVSALQEYDLTESLCWSY